MTRQASTASCAGAPPAGRGQALRAYWLAPQGLVMLAVTGLALAIRLYALTRVRYLTGITEYDDGVYLGGAVNLMSGRVPYHDFAFVQPPGILLLMAPAALIAKAFAVTSAMAAARLLTAVASAACVPLAGSLVRDRGSLVTLTACGVLAVYPDDIITARTLLLEPWMNLLVLGGARLAFGDGRLASRRLLASGVLFGLAGAVKYWAAIPALGMVAVCLLSGAGRAPTAGGGGRTSPLRTRTGQALRFGGGALAGFSLPVAPFAGPWPGLFLRSTLLDQASRTGSAVPVPLRLAHLTGLADLLDDAGRLTVSAGANSLFARGDVTAAATWATGWLPAALAVTVAAALCLGYLGGGPRAATAARGPLAWYALAMLAATGAAVLAYSAFFYHYPDFAAPWLALSAGYAAGALRDRFTGRRAAPRTSRRLAAGVAAAVVLAAAFQAWELSGLHAPDVHADAALIPPGACVVTDEISLAIAANRFTAGSGGCPDVLDSLATTLVAGNGASVEDGAAALPRVVTAWKAIFARARYAWLSSSSDRRIPWTPGLRQWFARAFRPLHPPRGEFSEGQVYVRRWSPPRPGQAAGPGGGARRRGQAAGGPGRPGRRRPG